MLKIIVQDTIFAEFEKSELQQSDTYNTIRGVGYILQNFSNHRYFVELSNSANKEMRKESQNLEKNKIILGTIRQKLATLDGGQIWKIINVYNRRGMWSAINYIRGHL